MTFRSALAALAPLALASLASAAAASEWTIDTAHSSAGFSVKHLMVSTVRGSFAGVAGTVAIDDKDVTKSKVDVTIDAKTIDTGNEKRDEHLRSADFFDVEKFPTITFKSTKVEAGDAGALKVTGDLTMHGVTKPVTLAVEPLAATIKDPWGRTVRGASATARIDRKDWGLTYNKTLDAGGVAVSDEVKLELDVELAQVEPPKAEPAAAPTK
jgi:polyisoprenoid-binding protein YceI